MKIVMMLIAYVLIYAACDVKRGTESKIKIFSKEWWLQVALVTAGGIMLTNYA